MATQKQRKTDPVVLLRRIQRACSNKDIVTLARAAMEVPGVRVKETSHGVIFIGPKGIAGTHLTPSDRRHVLNFRSDLRRAGIDV